MSFNKIWKPIMGLLIFGVLLLGFAPEKAASSTTGTFGAPVVFIDKTSIDLQWDHPDPSYDKYVISRDGAPILTTGTSVTFFRDTGLTQGETYEYQIDAFEGEDHKLSSGPKYATAGEIGGDLYQSKVWPAGNYYLYDHITVHAGTFQIQVGAVVATTPSLLDFKSISDGWSGGQVQLNEMTMETNLIISQAGSVVNGVTFDEGSTLYYERSDTFNSPNTFTDDAQLVIGHHTWAQPTIQGQTFKQGSQIIVKDAASAVIKDCSFDQAGIDVWGGGMATIMGNTFANGGDYIPNKPAIMLQSSAGDVEISENLFEDASIWVYATAADITIADNLMDGMNTANTALRVNGTADIVDNAIVDWGTGIYYTWSDAAGTVSGNTITLGGTGIYITVDAMPVIQQNCIAGNGEGVYVGHSRTKILDLTANWWGSPTGPYNYEANPTGTGNRVYGTLANFSGWLTTDNCSAVDVKAIDVEPVQAIQSINDNLPAAAGRETIVRAYANSRIGAANNIEGELHGYRAGTYLGKLTSENEITAVSLDSEAALLAARGDLTEGAVYFELPEAWTTPGVLTYSVTLNPDNSPVELRTTNNTLTSTVTFHDQHPFRVAYVPILYSSGEGGAVPPSAGQILKGHSFLQSIYPHAEVDMGLFPAMTWKKPMKGAETKQEYTNGDDLLNILSVILIKWNITHPPEERFNQIMGVFPGGTLDMISFGYSDPRWAAGDGNSMGLGLASYCWASGDCFAHEIGHNLGLHHTNVEGKDCFADDYDSYWKQNYIDNTISDFGYYDVRDELVPADTPDFMSYCEDTWISALHWQMLLEANGVPQPAYANEVSVTAPTTAQNAPSAETSYLLVRAWTSFEGVTEFLPFWTATSTNGLPVWTPDNGSEYCVRMEDNGGGVIEEKCMDAYFANHETNDWAITNHFIAALPLPASLATESADNPLAGVAEISVFSDKFNQEVATRQPSTHAPTVTLISPSAGTTLTGDTLIQWTGADADSDPLIYAVYYRSAAEAPWNPLVVDTVDNSYLAALQDLPAGNAAQFKVEASDGYHVVAALSGTVAVPERGPAVYLLAPVADENYETILFLSGYGYDPDDGLLSADALTWSSDQDGVLGTGEALTVTLSTGTHRITLTGAHDSQPATATVDITVSAAPVAIVAPSISGPDEVPVGTPVTLEASVYAGTNVTYTWDFKDGTTATGKTVTHIFPFYANTYNVKLTATNALTLRTAYKNITITGGSTGFGYQLFLPLLAR